MLQTYFELVFDCPNVCSNLDCNLVQQYELAESSIYRDLDGVKPESEEEGHDGLGTDGK